MNRIMRQFRIALRAAAISSAISLLVTSTAIAHHDDGPRLRTRDNNTQEYEHVNLTSAGEIACDWGATQLGRSEIIMSQGDNDIHCHDMNSADSARAWVECTSTVWWNRRCDHYRIEFNLRGMDTTPDSNSERNFWRAVGCHELGHTGSIGHVDSNQTCMRSWVVLGLVNPLTLTSDDLDHINDAL